MVIVIDMFGVGIEIISNILRYGFLLLLKYVDVIGMELGKFNIYVGKVLFMFFIGFFVEILLLKLFCCIVICIYEEELKVR